MPEFDPSLASIHREILQAQRGNGADLLKQIFITHSMLFYSIPEGAVSYAEIAAGHLVNAIRRYKSCDIDAFKMSLLEYYLVIKPRSELKFDPNKAADLDAECWRLHGEYKGQPERAKLARAYANLYGCLFGVSPEELIEAGTYMALANYEVDLATDPITPDRLIDWHWSNAEEHLKEFYKSLGVLLDNGKPVPS